MGGRLDGKTSLERHSHLCPLAGLHPSPTSFDPHHHPSSTLRTLAPLKKKARFSTTLFVSYAGAARYAAEHLAHLLADDFGAFGPLAGKPYVVPAKAAAFVRFHWRASAEFAKEAMDGQGLDGSKYSVRALGQGGQGSFVCVRDGRSMGGRRGGAAAH